jgi:hypothetical protein
MAETHSFPVIGPGSSAGANTGVRRVRSRRDRARRPTAHCPTARALCPSPCRSPFIFRRATSVAAIGDRRPGSGAVSAAGIERKRLLEQTRLRFARLGRELDQTGEIVLAQARRKRPPVDLQGLGPPSRPPRLLGHSLGPSLTLSTRMPGVLCIAGMNAAFLRGNRRAGFPSTRYLRSANRLDQCNRAPIARSTSGQSLPSSTKTPSIAIT